MENVKEGFEKYQQMASTDIIIAKPHKDPGQNTHADVKEAFCELCSIED